MQRYGHQIAGMDVPGAGDDLYRFGLPRVDLADPHMVAVRVALHGQDAATTTLEISAPRSAVVSTLEPERVMASSNSLSSAATVTNSLSHFSAQ